MSDAVAVRSSSTQDAEPAAPSAVERATSKALVTIVDNVGRLAASTGRADLARRLDHTHERLQDPNVRVIVVGEFKQGKSKLINALVNAPVCPVDDDVATSVPTSVGYAATPGFASMP